MTLPWTALYLNRIIIKVCGHGTMIISLNLLVSHVRLIIIKSNTLETIGSSRKMQCLPKMRLRMITALTIFISFIIILYVKASLEYQNISMEHRPKLECKSGGHAGLYLQV